MVPRDEANGESGEARSPFDELYGVGYHRLSWYIHSGLTGPANLEKESLELMAGIAFDIAIKSYLELLALMIDKFKLDKPDPKIKIRMTDAKDVA